MNVEARSCAVAIALAFTGSALSASPQSAPHSTGERPHLGGFVREITDLAEPSSAAFDEGGALYVVEPLAARVSVFDAAGKQTRSFGERGAGPGELLDPEGIGIAPDGEVYVSDAENDRVQVFDRTGKPLRSIGKRGAGAGEMRRPLGIAVDGSKLYVADSLNHRVDVFERGGRFRASFGRFGRASGEMNHPADVAVDAHGNLYVADRDNERVQKLDADGKTLAVFGEFGPYPGLLAAPSGVRVSGEQLFVADRDNHRVEVYDLVGKRIYGFGVHALRPHEGGGRMHYPSEVAIAPSGELAAVVEGFENRCQVFGAATPESLELERSQEQAAAAHYGGGIDVQGDVLAVVEPATPGVVAFDLTQSEPIEITRFGAFGAGFGQFAEPSGVALEPAEAPGERAWIADPGAYRIALFDVTRAPGTPLNYDPTLARFVKSLDLRALRTSDNHAATFAIEPEALHIDREGELFVVDAANARVVVLDRDLNVVHTIGESVAGSWKMRRPTGVARDRAREIVYVVDALDCRVAAFHADGRPAFAFGRRGEGPGELTAPHGIAAGRDGFVYVTDSGADRVLKFDEKGTFVAAFGRRGLGRVEFYKPKGIAQDSSGRLFVLDYGNHRGQILSADGEFIAAFGSRLFTQPTRSAR
jgi:DNA-binding beta-propeller fold protein YncE